MVGLTGHTSSERLTSSQFVRLISGFRAAAGLTEEGPRLVVRANKSFTIVYEIRYRSLFSSAASNPFFFL